MMENEEAAAAREVLESQ
jgi:hypothetical protein